MDSDECPSLFAPRYHIMESTPPNLKTTARHLIQSFNQYAGAEGCSHTLSRDEFKTMVRNEMPELLKDPSNQSEIDSLFDSMDSNDDQEIDFREFVFAVASITCMFYEISTAQYFE